MKAFQPLSKLPQTFDKMSSSISYMREIASFKYWRPEARQFRMALDEWEFVSAHIRLLLDDLDEAFRNQGRSARNIQEDLREFTDLNWRVKKIHKKLASLSQRLNRLRREE